MRFGRNQSMVHDCTALSRTMNGKNRRKQAGQKSGLLFDACTGLHFSAWWNVTLGFSVPRQGKTLLRAQRWLQTTACEIFNSFLECYLVSRNATWSPVMEQRMVWLTCSCKPRATRGNQDAVRSFLTASKLAEPRPRDGGGAWADRVRFRQAANIIARSLCTAMWVRSEYEREYKRARGYIRNVDSRKDMLLVPWQPSDRIKHLVEGADVAAR